MAQSRSDKLSFRPRIELLEDRLLLFANQVHKDLTIEALPFIKADVMDDINDEHSFQEIFGFLASEEHFDNCNFSGSATEINENYDDALIQADPNDFDDEDITDQFGQMLHGAQDFYAHSNWVDLGQSSVVDRGLGKWSAMTAYSIRNGVMFVQGENQTPNVAPFGQATLSRNGHVVTVSFPGGITFPGVISGTFGLVDDCPDNPIAESHGDLNKDDASKTLHPQARVLAVQQTEHEFRRFCHLIKDQYGQPGVDKFLEEWVKPDAASMAMAQDLCTSSFPTANPIFEDINPNRSNFATPPADITKSGAGGRVNGLAAVPGNNLIFFAASEWGGLYKTTDGGDKWNYLDGHFPQVTWDVEVNPAIPDRVYATSFYDGRKTSISGIQVSTDEGTSWSHPVSATPPLPMATFNCPEARRTEPSAFGIGISPGASQDVFVGTNCGVAISRDFGDTWTYVDPTLTTPATDVWDVVVQGSNRSFVGKSPPVMGSTAKLDFSVDIKNDKVFQWKSNDSILGAIDTGGFITVAPNPNDPANKDKWTFVDGSPKRVVFEATRNLGASGVVTFAGNAIFEPYSRAVVDVTQTKGGMTKRVRYLLVFGPIDICGDDGHLRSLDGGGTWRPDTNPLPAKAHGRCSIAASPDEPDVLFVAGADNIVYESDDAGANWTPLGNPAPIGRIPFVVTNDRTDAVGVQKFDLWFGDQQLFVAPCQNPPPGRPTRCPLALAWKNAQAGAHVDAGDLAFDGMMKLNAVPKIYSNDGGVYRNTGVTAEDTSWTQPVVAPHALWLYGMDGANQAGDEAEDLYFGAQDNGFWATQNAGRPSNSGAAPPDPGPTWEHRQRGDGADIVADPNRVLFLLGSPFSVLRANPGGGGATEINPQPMGTLPEFNFPDFIDRFADKKYVAVTTHGAFFTDDVTAAAVDWVRLGRPNAAGDPRSTPAGGFCAVQAAVSGGMPTFYAQTKCIRVFETDGPAQLWKYTGTGAGDWVQVDTNIPGGGGIGIFAVDPNNPMRLYASQLPAAGDPRMVLSTDGGMNWKKPVCDPVVDPPTACDAGLKRLNDLMDGNDFFKYRTLRGPTSFNGSTDGITGGNLPGMITGFRGYAQPSLLAFDPDTRFNNIVAGGRDSGVFLSTDGGTSWQLLTNPVNPSSVKPHLPRPWFAYFDHEPADKLKIYVGTQGRGVWRITLDVLSPLHVAGQPVGGDTDSDPLTFPKLEPIVAQAITEWASSYGDPALQIALRDVKFFIADLPGSILGLASSSVFWLDQDAAGYGWYIDASPSDSLEFGFAIDDQEFGATVGSPAFGKVDLLTVVMHELGHVLGLGHTDAHDLMGATLELGVRRMPTILVSEVPDTAGSKSLAMVDSVGSEVSTIVVNHRPGEPIQSMAFGPATSTATPRLLNDENRGDNNTLDSFSRAGRIDDAQDTGGFDSPGVAAPMESAIVRRLPGSSGLFDTALMDRVSALDDDLDDLIRLLVWDRFAGQGR